MKPIKMIIMTLLLTALLAGTALAAPFESGSSCSALFFNSTTCRGAYVAPTPNSVIALPPSGILDYTTFTVPDGYTLSFIKNAANTPVIIRTSGNVVISGQVYVSAQTAPTDSGEAGNGNLGDDGQPGTSGPGGYDGGRGGLSPLFGGAAYIVGGAGRGPGGGNSAPRATTDCWGNPTYPYGGSGGGFGSAGGDVGYSCFNGYGWVNGVFGGTAYGQPALLPLIGGSGGAGGRSGSSFNGGGGGGGGGAITIASSGTILMGNASWEGPRIFANGTGGGTSQGSGCGGGGGGGSGGGIRLVAETLAMNSNAYLQAIGGGGGGSCDQGGGGGGTGRIRLEANTITGWSTDRSNPAYSFGTPGHVFVPNNPTLKIVSVNGSNVPPNPTGNADITFPTGTTTATVNLAATGIPQGSTAYVHVIPSSGAPRTVVQSVAFGTPDVNGILTPVTPVTVTLSPGNNILQAVVTYTVTETIASAMGLPKFNGEYVAKIRVEGGMSGKSKVTYITASGKEYPADKAKA
jgi:hypothetical protein